MNSAHRFPARLQFLVILLALGFLTAPAWSVAASLTGSVRDRWGNPIADARVRIIGEKEFVVTDTRGRFELPLKSPTIKFFQFPVSAGKEGWLNAASIHRPGSRSMTIVLQRAPRADFADYPMMITSPAGPLPRNLVQNRGMGMMAARDCGNCHTTHLWEWGSSKMGKTALNTKVREQYSRFVLEKRPDQQNSCADCHLPIAALQNPGKTDLALAARQNWNLSKGIECDFCHKIREVGVGNKPGVQAITMTRVSMGGGMMSPLLAYGPYDDVVAMPMAASYNPLLATSEFCSSCHQDAFTLPEGRSWDVDSVYPEAKEFALYEEGRVIPNQWTYQEWLEWQESLEPDAEDKGRQCQNCHMNWTKEMLPYYRYIVNGQVRASMGTERDPKDIFPHTFGGANPKRLAGSVRLQMETEVADNLLRVRVGVENVNAGHRLPTGEHTRNMILLVRAETEEGEPLALTDGPTVPAWGGTGQDDHDYGGLPGKGFARITGDDQGNINVPVWRATRIVSDNRIRAKQADVSAYDFALPVGWEEDDTLYVTARLLYRSDFKTAESRDRDIVMQEKTVETGNGEL